MRLLKFFLIKAVFLVIMQFSNPCWAHETLEDLERLNDDTIGYLRDWIPTTQTYSELKAVDFQVQKLEGEGGSFNLGIYEVNFFSFRGVEDRFIIKIAIPYSTQASDTCAEFRQLQKISALISEEDVKQGSPLIPRIKEMQSVGPQRNSMSLCIGLMERARGVRADRIVEPETVLRSKVAIGKALARFHTVHGYSHGDPNRQNFFFDEATGSAIFIDLGTSREFVSASIEEARLRMILEDLQIAGMNLHSFGLLNRFLRPLSRELETRRDGDQNLAFALKMQLEDQRHWDELRKLRWEMKAWSSLLQGYFSQVGSDSVLGRAIRKAFSEKCARMGWTSMVEGGLPTDSKKPVFASPLSQEMSEVLRNAFPEFLECLQGF